MSGQKDNDYTGNPAEYQTWSAGAANAPQTRKTIEPRVLGFPRTTMLMFIMLIAGLVWVLLAMNKVKVGCEKASLEEKRSQLQSSCLFMKKVVSKKNAQNEKFYTLVNSVKLPVKNRQVALDKKINKPFNMMVFNEKVLPGETDPNLPALKNVRLEKTVFDRNFGSYAVINGQRKKIGDTVNGWEILEIHPDYALLGFDSQMHRLMVENKAKAQELGPVIVDEIKKQGSGFIAIIAGRKIKPGDTYKGWLVADISADSVGFKNGKRTKKINWEFVTPDISDLKIEAISGSGKDAMIIINGKLYQPGQRVNGWKIIGVKSHSIILRYKIVERELKLR